MMKNANISAYKHYLHCFVEPSVSGVTITTAAMNHLMRHIWFVSTIRFMSSYIRSAKAIRIERNRQRFVQTHQAESRLNQFDIMSILIDH